MKADHERIWLQNADDAAHCTEGRLWCQDKVWPVDKEDGEPTEYVRVDLLSTARAEARKAALEEAAKVAYGVPKFVTSFEPDERGNLPPGSPYDRGRYDAATAIRALIGTDPTDRGEG